MLNNSNEEFEKKLEQIDINKEPPAMIPKDSIILSKKQENM